VRRWLSIELLATLCSKMSFRRAYSRIVSSRHGCDVDILWCSKACSIGSVILTSWSRRSKVKVVVIRFQKWTVRLEFKASIQRVDPSSGIALMALQPRPPWKLQLQNFVASPGKLRRTDHSERISGKSDLAKLSVQQKEVMFPRC
jgi:hypothetical protein